MFFCSVIPVYQFKSNQGYFYLFVAHCDYIVGRCSKSSCTVCTLRFLRSVRLVLTALTTINRDAHKKEGA